jgi:hypothetical protein
MDRKLHGPRYLTALPLVLSALVLSGCTLWQRETTETTTTEDATTETQVTREMVMAERHIPAQMVGDQVVPAYTATERTTTYRERLTEGEAIREQSRHAMDATTAPAITGAVRQAGNALGMSLGLGPLGDTAAAVLGSLAAAKGAGAAYKRVRDAPPRTPQQVQTRLGRKDDDADADA